MRGKKNEGECVSGEKKLGERDREDGFAVTKRTFDACGWIILRRIFLLQMLYNFLNFYIIKCFILSSWSNKKKKDNGIIIVFVL